MMILYLCIIAPEARVKRSVWQCTMEAIKGCRKHNSDSFCSSASTLCVNCPLFGVVCWVTGVCLPAQDTLRLGTSCVYIAWWLRTRGFYPGFPCSVWSRLRADRSSYLCHVEETVVPVPESCVGASCHRKIVTTDASLTGLRAVMEGCFVKVCGEGIISLET